MRSTLPLAASLVRAWTRIYTHGLPEADRTARRAEIESDLWEFEHDPDAPRGARAAAQVLARLLLGLPDDLAWRMAPGATLQRAPERALATAGVMTGPRRVSAFGLAATIHVVAITAVTWVVSSGPVLLPIPGKAAPPAPAPPRPLDRFLAKVLQNRYALSVRNGQLEGAGAQLLQSAVVQSRFVLLGENHGVAQTPELGAALCSAGPERFQTMAIEESPMAASELEAWARRPDGLARLAAFERTFPDYSLNVYGFREEFEMLQQCARAAQGEFHLWGLNQEALGAAGPILARILESRLGEPARSLMQQLRQKDEDAHRRALHSGGIGDLFMLSADDQDLARGAAALERDGSPEARSLFASLVQSREIYRPSPADYDNAGRRARLMKTRFAAGYTRAAATAGTPPRVLLKLGAYHVYRGLNPMHGSDIGNYVAEFAESQRAQSLHVRLMAVKGSEPFFPRVGQPAQLRPVNLEHDPYSQYLQPLLNNRLPSGWTLFDLRPLRHDFNALLRGTSPELATLVFGIDMLVLVPEGTPSTAIH